MESLTLFELNARVRQCLERGLPGQYWVHAELSEVRPNAAGHCYVEFVQKNTRGGGLLARARGTIWSGTYHLLCPHFERETGQPFQAGIKVSVLVSVTFHEQYGYSLVVHDIDPAYTLGDLALRRRQILQALEADGVLTLNKELPLPVLPQRIAVISSATAAGYGDFSDQLAHNPRGYYLHAELFPAIMQGERMEQSVLAALDRIMERLEEFDVVVIIRGGGATADLSGFDSYELAAGCAQFPLPIITGIGHERDDTVLDLVAHTRVKTPTAAAELLIGRMDQAANALDDLADRLQRGAATVLLRHRQWLQVLTTRIPLVANRSISASRLRLDAVQLRLAQSVRMSLHGRQTRLDALGERLAGSARRAIDLHRHRLTLIGQRLKDNSPDRLLALGYSITLGPDGRAVRNAATLNQGATLTTRFHQGEATSVVTATRTATCIATRTATRTAADPADLPH